ncbi:yippee-like protein [Obelidium mucronatum]|nr:yippee-like protein [Obelidium mucronatum]
MEEASPSKQYHSIRPKGKIFQCQSCKMHLSHSFAGNVMSTSFTGLHGRASLVKTVFNICIMEPQKRHMTTGNHIVSDISCLGCNKVVGWKYIKADQASQKYKEGHFLLESNLVDPIQPS